MPFSCEVETDLTPFSSEGVTGLMPFSSKGDTDLMPFSSKGETGLMPFSCIPLELTLVAVATKPLLVLIAGGSVSRRRVGAGNTLA